MKFKLCFDPDMKKTVEIILKNEKESFSHKLGKSKVSRVGRWARKKMFGAFEPIFNYTVHDDHAVVEIITGFDMFTDEKRVLRSFQKYDKLSKGKITTELIEK